MESPGAGRHTGLAHVGADSHSEIGVHGRGVNIPCWLHSKNMLSDLDHRRAAIVRSASIGRRAGDFCRVCKDCAVCSACTHDAAYGDDATGSSRQVSHLPGVAEAPGGR